MAMGKNEMTGLAKIGIGSARIVGGFATAFGKGLIGTFFNNHGMTHVGIQIAARSIKAGAKMVREGLEDLNRKEVDYRS